MLSDRGMATGLWNDQRNESDTTGAVQLKEDKNLWQQKEES